MKKFFLTSSLILAITSIGHTQTKNFIDQPYIEVNGYADTLVTPNEIFIKIVISERDSKDKISVEEMENKMVAALKSLSIDTEKDLTTNDMGSNYRSYIFKHKDVLKTKQYILKVADAVTASKVFMTLEDLDISNTSIDRINHTDFELIKNVTRARAAGNAKTKATLLTKPLGQSIGQAIYINDNEENNNITNSLQGRLPGVQLDEVVVTGYGKLKQQSSEPSKIEFKKIKVATTVSVKFILK